MKKFWVRADGEDQHDSTSLTCMDRAGLYTSDYSGGVEEVEEDVVNELEDRNGGFAFNENGDACKYVAPSPKRQSRL